MHPPSRLAWLLRALCALQLAALAAWLAWRWPGHPVQAVAGALVIAGIAPLVLAVEFGLLALVARHTPGEPGPRAGQLARAWLTESLDLYRVFYWRLAWRWREPVDHLEPACAGQTGVVLVHGFVANRGIWAPWMRRLRAEGRAFVAVNLEPVFASIDDYAPIIDRAVDQVAACTRRPPVLLCHSMGGLAARAWLRASGGHDRVAHVITLGTPHGGTWLGRFASTLNGRQMRLHNVWLQQLAQDEEGQPQPPWTCWYGTCDNIVFPVTTAIRVKADNRRAEGLPHVALALDAGVMDACMETISASSPSVSR